MAAAQTAAPTITDVRIEQEGRTVSDPLVLGLIETKPGEPLSVAEVRESITHLMSLTRYEDVQVSQEPSGAGVRLRYVLFPIHAVDRVELRGTLGLAESDLRRAITQRFGVAPPASRADEVARALQVVYRDRGYLQPRIAPAIEVTHDPDRASMVLNIESGPRALIRQIELDAEPADRGALGNSPAAVGQPYDAAVLDAQLQRYQAILRGRGFYEARAMASVDYRPDGALVRVTIERGPHVSVAFDGDPLPEAERDRLVPIRTEGSADEDLLEDSSRAIEDYFRERGYRDATASYMREVSPAGDELTIRFTVIRGPRYVVDDVAVTGNTAIPSADLAPIVRLKGGDPFVQANLDASVSGIRGIYRNRGFTKAVVMPGIGVLPGGNQSGADRYVKVSVDIAEGPRTLVGSVDITGNIVVSDNQLRSMLTVVPGRPYSEVEVASDRDRIDLEYRNRGYENIVVEPGVTLSDADTRASVVFTVSEGPQVIVDHVIIIGNRRTRTSTIERELTLKPGQPLGYAARIESQRRLSALGLFRRVNITELQHESEPRRRDVLVQVEESPPTTIGYGGGVEGGTRLRPTGPNGQAEEQFEFAPRGFFEIGRSNLWGKNRSLNVFARASLRSRDIVLSPSGVRLASPAPGSGFGFNEYRILGTYREPKVFNTPADMLLTGIIDQAIRSSFNFRTREVRGELGARVRRHYSVAGRYSYEHTKLFDQRFTDDQKPLVDRFFPQVRISKFANAIIRDSRDDVLDPGKGTFVLVDTELAARAIGSEVGFVRTFAQAFDYYRVPAARRMVLAMGVRVGLAHGFPRIVQLVNPDGSVTFQTVGDLPASERFFAGGDTTVRGFSLDRLGTAETISDSGFPRGGNGEVVLNAELRVAALKGLTGVTFLDAGNIFTRASDLSFTDLRPAAGFGVHYRSPIGPLRVELGFNLDPRELVPGRLERRTTLHISLGQAF